MSVSYAIKSYKEDYKDITIASSHVLQPSTSPQRRPNCPQCRTKVYVTYCEYGLVGDEEFVFLKDGQEPEPEPIHSTRSCIYEGYDWDCARCMIIFGDKRKVVNVLI